MMVNVACRTVCTVLWIVFGARAWARAGPRTDKSFKRIMNQAERIQHDAAALEADEAYANIGGASVTICGGYNPERMMGWFALVVEAPTLLSLALVPPSIWHESLRQVRQVAVATSVTIDWANPTWVLGTLGAFLGFVAVVCLLRKMEKMVWFQGIVLDLMFVRVVCRAASIMVCEGEQMRALPHHECGTLVHGALATIGVVLFAALYVSAMHYTVVTKENRRPAFRYNPRFSVVLAMTKAFAAALVVWFRETYPLLVMVGLAIAMATMWALNLILVPCYGRGRGANNVRAATFACACWLSACGCVSYLTGAARNDSVALVCFGGLPFVGMGSVLWNDGRAKKHSIPNEPIEALLQSPHLYVREVACCTLAQRNASARTYECELARILLSSPLESEISLCLWASIGLLRGCREPARKQSRLSCVLKNSKILPVMGIQFRTFRILSHGLDGQTPTQHKRVLLLAFRFLRHLVVDSQAEKEQIFRASRAIFDLCASDEVGARAWLVANARCVSTTNDVDESCEMLHTIQSVLKDSLDDLTDDDPQQVAHAVLQSYFSIRRVTPVLRDLSDVAHAETTERSVAVRSVHLMVEIMSYLVDLKFDAALPTIDLFLQTILSDGLLRAWDRGIHLALESLLRAYLGRGVRDPHEWQAILARIDTARSVVARGIQRLGVEAGVEAVPHSDVALVMHNLPNDSRFWKALLAKARFNAQVRRLTHTEMVGSVSLR